MAKNESPKSRLGRKILIILLIAVILAALELFANFPEVATPLERLELAAMDTAIRIRGNQPPDENIVIVAIDDASLGWVSERWPWSRSRMADIVNWLNQAGARTIAYDIFLFDPAFSPEEDDALAEAFRKANSVVTVSQIFSTQYSTTLDRPEEIFLPVIDGYGLTEIERDDDAIVRGVNAYEEFKDEVIYNWAFDVARVFLETGPPSNPTPASVMFNGEEVPLNQRGELLVNYAGPPQTYPTYSIAFVTEGDYDPAIFKDKIVLIGATSETLQDLYPTPFSATNLTPGVEVVANTIATLLSGKFLSLAPPWVTLVLILGMAILSQLLITIPRPTLSSLLMAAGVLLYITLRQVIFYRAGLQLPIVSPSLTLILGVVIPTLEQAVTQEIEKRRIRGLFSRFISPQMVNQLLDTQDIDSLNKRTELTILFSDIRDFTSLSESMTPEDLVVLLNPYLETMSKIIHKYGGTVDKYEGDAIVAFFGEPIPHNDHAIRAAFAALEMNAALQELNETWRSTGILASTLEMGIGLNTGEVFVGLLGSEERINYTVIGDAANLAARLQDQTKELGHPILISADTYRAIKETVKAEFLTSRILKGKSEPVDIYHLISLRPDH
jgi:adenylate cyclase